MKNKILIRYILFLMLFIACGSKKTDLTSINEIRLMIHTSNIRVTFHGLLQLDKDKIINLIRRPPTGYLKFPGERFLVIYGTDNFGKNYNLFVSKMPDNRFYIGVRDHRIGYILPKNDSKILFEIIKPYIDKNQYQPTSKEENINNSELKILFYDKIGKGLYE